MQSSATDFVIGDAFAFGRRQEEFSITADADLVHGHIARIGKLGGCRFGGLQTWQVEFRAV